MNWAAFKYTTSKRNVDLSNGLVLKAQTVGNHEAQSIKYDVSFIVDWGRWVVNCFGTTYSTKEMYCNVRYSLQSSASG